MIKRLYIGGLSYATTEENLKKLFSQSGQVMATQIVTDRETGRSKGFGFVQMGTDAEVDNSFKTLNQTRFEGRILTLIVTNSQEEKRSDAAQIKTPSNKA